MEQEIPRLLAGLVLAAHWAFACFVVLGLPAIWAGALLGWGFVRAPWFRRLHLLAMGLVLALSALGLACPLTLWEHALRRGAPGEAAPCMERMVRSLLYWDLSATTFLVLYALFFLLILLTWKLVPVGRGRRKATAPKNKTTTQ